MKSQIVLSLLAFVGAASSAFAQTARLGTGASIDQDPIFAPYRACVARTISRSPDSAMVDLSVYRTLWEACDEEKQRALAIATDRPGLESQELLDLRTNTRRALEDSLAPAIISEIAARGLRRPTPAPFVRGQGSH